MRKQIAAILVTITLSTLTAFADVGFQTTGFGNVVPVTATPKLITGFAANLISVYNAGTNTVFCLVNSTVANMTTAMITTNAIPITPAGTFTFNTYGKTDIKNILFATDNGTATSPTSIVNFGAY